MNPGIRRIRRLLSLEKPTAGPRPSQPSHSTQQSAGDRTMSYRRNQFGPRQSF